MVSRFGFVSALGLLAAGCNGAAPGAESPAPEETLILRGFQRVDVEPRSISEGDVVLERGVVVAHPTLQRQRVVEGHGAFLMPALWDLKSSLWGNDSTHNWDELTQDATVTHSLQVQLYYGVAHVGTFAMAGDWLDRELKRADALELSAAEPLYTAEVLCSAASFACNVVKTVADIAPILQQRQERHAPLVEISALDAKHGPLRGVSPELLGSILAAASARHLPALVLVSDWSRASFAVEHGAAVIYGLPGELPPDDLVRRMRERNVAFAPALTFWLELDRLLGHSRELEDPLLKTTVRPDVLRTFLSERELWSEFRPDLALSRQHHAVMLESVQRFAEAGVRLLATSDAGWGPGTFQGYSSLALQSWLERAHVDAWARLSAATIGPAALLGRRVGFAPGDAADFVTFAESPVEHAENLRGIQLVIRRGKVVDRQRLLSDLTRGGYPQ